MNLTNATISLIGIANASLFGWLALRELFRYHSITGSGTRTEAEIVSVAQRRIGERPLPILKFKDEKGKEIEFRSRFPRSVKSFAPPERVEIAFKKESPNDAEVVSWTHCYTHIGWHLFIIVPSIALAFLPLFIK